MKKHHKPKKGSKKKSHPKKKGLGATKAMSDRAKGIMSGLVESGKSFVGHIGGFLGGAMVAKAMDKIPFLAENPADGTAVSVLKKIAKPATLLVVGTGTQMVAKKKNLQFVKAIGQGVNVSGAFCAVKTFAKSDIFSGLGDPDSMGANENAEYFRETSDALKQVAEENKARLNLASAEENMSGGDYENRMDGLSIPGTQLNLVDTKMLL